MLALSWTGLEELCLSSIWIYCLIYVSCIMKCYECSPIWFTQFNLNLWSTRISRSTLIFWQTKSADGSAWKAHYAFGLCITGISTFFLSPAVVACLVSVTIFVIQNLKADQHQKIVHVEWTRLEMWIKITPKHSNRPKYKYFLL